MKRMFACFFVMAVLPLVTSPTKNSPNNSAPFTTVAYAGHTVIGGGWCDCGAPGCICDPGETPGGGSYASTAKDNDESSDQGPPPIPKSSGFDFGTGTMIFALALFLWTRMRP